MDSKHKKEAMVQRLLDHLTNHPRSPNRNKIGVTFNKHFQTITDLSKRGKYVYKVIEYKNNGVLNFFALGITSGMITGYAYYMVDVNNKELDPIIWGDQEGTTYVTDSTGSGDPTIIDARQGYQGER